MVPRIRPLFGPIERRLEALTWLIADCSRGLVLGLWTSSGGEELMEIIAHVRSFLVDDHRARSHMQNQTSRQEATGAGGGNDYPLSNFIATIDFKQ